MSVITWISFVIYRIITVWIPTFFCDVVGYSNCIAEFMYPIHDITNYTSTECINIRHIKPFHWFKVFLGVGE